VRVVVKSVVSDAVRATSVAVVSLNVNSPILASVNPLAAVLPQFIAICDTVIENSGVKNWKEIVPLTRVSPENASWGRNTVSTKLPDCPHGSIIPGRRGTLLLSRASGSVPLVRSEADVVAIPPPETPTST
jgi:hypothetical protein